MFPIRIKLKKFKTSRFRLEQNYYLKKWCSSLNAKTVINLGAEPAAPDKEGKKYKDYFPEAAFSALDQHTCNQVGYIQADLMEPLGHLGKFDLVLIMSVIEHIDKPWLAVPNIIDLIKPGGHLYVTMPWFYPSHPGPGFGDHWRATPSGVKILFESLDLIEEASMPSSIVAFNDRKYYWRDKDTTSSGSNLLFRKPFP